mmetsp:Transcript_20546/g.61842  ORF Transcript_20546/g.61842 Transcript_20546/m.61842 type:complete len:282 (-) Transcript_20546:670-1515(-)
MMMLALSAMTPTSVAAAVRPEGPLRVGVPRAPTAQLLRSPPQCRRVQPFSAGKRRMLHVQATEGAAAEAETAVSPGDSDDDVAQAAQVLRTAASAGAGVGKEVVFKALKTLEKKRLKGGEEWYKGLSGERSPGRRWRLVYTVGKDELQKDLRGERPAKGAFFPLLGAQRYDPAGKYDGTLENGVFLGHVANLVFSGPQHYTPKNKLVFNFWRIDFKVGPLKFGFDIKKGDKDAPFDPNDKGLPFFVFFYVDEHICCARGRGGGWAFWARTDPKWDLEHGII